MLVVVVQIFQKFSNFVWCRKIYFPYCQWDSVLKCIISFQNLNFFLLSKIILPKAMTSFWLSDVIELLYVIRIITLLNVNIIIDVIGWEPLTCFDVKIFTGIVAIASITWAMKKLYKSADWLTNQKQGVDCCWISLHIFW